MAGTQDTVSGLERLTSLETITINQLVSSHKGNNFNVLGDGEVLFNLIEEGHDFSLFSGGRRRRFHIHGVDSTGRKVFSLHRPEKSMSDKVELFMNEALVSVVRLKAVFLTPVIRIYDAQDNLILRVKGKATGTANFQLQTSTKTPVGSIHKKTHSSVREIFSHLDDYVIRFPADLDVHLKVAVIAACVLIDFRFHEFN